MSPRKQDAGKTLLGVFREHLGPVLIALIGMVATITTLVPGAGGAGVTCDEFYHVAAGKRLVSAVREQGIAFFAPNNIQRNFPWRHDGVPVQAPLGHWILGGIHYLFDPAPDDPGVISIAAARFAPAMALGILVLLIGSWTVRREGQLAGTVAAAGVVLVPRLFGHAHFAALDMLTALLCVGAVLAVSEANSRGGRWWHFALAGVVWGLAMLTRLHGVLIALPIVAWLVWQWRGRVLRPLIAWGTAGVATFFIGWPWLWLSPLGNLCRYISSGAGRRTVNVFYFGQVWADRDAPWHYPWVMFFVTLPLGLLALGLLGIWSKRHLWKRQPDWILVGGTLLFFLVIFSLPGTPVYDGVRLFLMVFPLWAIWVGIGARWIVDHRALAALSHRLRILLLASFLLLQGIGVAIYHPCQLSYYNLLVGGLWGAEPLGFEVSYWGDAVGEPLLAAAAAESEDGTILFGPNLPPWHAASVALASPALSERRVEMVGWRADEPNHGSCRWAVVFHRRADPRAGEWILANGRVVDEYAIQGVWLVRLVELHPPRTN